MEGDDIENGGEREGVGGGERVLMMNREVSGIDYSLRLRPHEVDDNESQWTSWLVPLIVLANAVMFAVVMSVNNCPKHKHHSGCVPRFLGRFSFEPVSENPLFGPSSLTLRKLGALEHTDLMHKHQAWRLLSCIWLHAGFVHLLVNLLSLVFIGIRLEQQFGFVRFALIYILSGYGGSVFSSLLVHKFVSVGASGALFGLLGAMLSELITNWTTYTNKFAALLTLMFIAGINLVVGIMPHVSNVANVGGFLTGFFLGFVLLLRPQIGWLPQSNPAHHPFDNPFDKIKYQLHQNVLRLVALLLLIIWLVVGTVMLFRGKKGNVLNV